MLSITTYLFKRLTRTILKSSDSFNFLASTSTINLNGSIRSDEKLKNSLLYKIARKEYKGEYIPPDSEDYVSNDNLFNYQAKVIKGLADQESCVIVGRCADYILRDRDNVVKIFVHASMEDCIARLEDMFSLSESELEKKIKKIDKRRADYYKYYTKRDWDCAKNYDLCLNSGQLGYDKCI